MSSPPETYLSTSFVGDLSYQPPSSQAAGLAHTFVTGRKTWKTLKSKKNEAVWPVHIEAALFDALEKYRPTSSGDPKLLRRFPKRNRFISDHIFKVTGKLRTPKQVGSRLQQLRDTCQEERVLQLLSRREYPPLSEDSSFSSNQSDSSASPGIPSPSPPSSTSSSPVPTPTDIEFVNLYSRGLSLQPQPTPSPSPSVVHIEIVSDPSLEIKPLVARRAPLDPTNLVTFDLPLGASHEQRQVRLDRAALCNGATPSISFSSSERIVGQYRSMYCVFFDDSLLHTEVTDFVPHSVSRLSGRKVYQTSLVPGYWESLAMTCDLPRYTIAQDVMKVTATEDVVLFSTTYKFKPVPLLSPNLPDDIKPPVIVDYFSDVELPVAGTPDLGPTQPLCAIRPPFIDTSTPSPTIDLTTSNLHTGNVWFDHCGQYAIAMPQPVAVNTQPLDFINLNGGGCASAVVAADDPTPLPYFSPAVFWS